MNILFSVALGMLLSLSAQASYLEHPDARAFAERMVSEHGFERAVVDSLLDAAEKKQTIIDAMERPAEKVKPWKDYRKIFITEKRITEGVDFWRKNRAILSEASSQYQVAPEVIVAIIGVETFYGRIKGSFRVIDALATLSFDYPPRSPFFTKQLEQFLLLAREQDQDPLTLMGSYAGAMGYGQFIPSSYRSFAVDFDGDGFADIWENRADAIGSVANYFAEHGWRMNETVVVRARMKSGFDEGLLNQAGLDRTVDELAELGFSSEMPLNGCAKAVPVRLDGDKGLEYWLGLNNFYVITRYNRSILYAMAVHELSQQILERVGEDTL
ncbi:lytic murein transglycosylase B [uncultured Porticoccus sp.]|uniref:lytic murein transglycosylase B n=1 Tax=uncultured Porticoccus sp. TaxID=1256050 RepID=UPI0030D7E87B|tara:strand:- start:3233 stop:4213 length:981 start_codon:yes stop_codon:yes gene_type:complete